MDVFALIVDPTNHLPHRQTPILESLPVWPHDDEYLAIPVGLGEATIINNLLSNIEFELQTTHQLISSPIHHFAASFECVQLRCDEFCRWYGQLHVASSDG